MECNLLV